MEVYENAGGATAAARFEEVCFAFIDMGLLSTPILDRSQSEPS
jgi:hypothetical protein